MATRESPIDVYNNMWCDECDKEVESNERAYHCRACEDFDICENCHLHGSKHVDPSHTFQLVTFKGAPSDANMMSDPRDCSKCDRKMEKGELFYHSKEDDDYDLCIDCYDKKISKRKISEEDFQLMVYCLPSEGALIVENRRCGQCRQKIPRPDMFYVDKSNPQYDLCQSCFVKGGYQGNMFQLVAYEPGHTDDEDESEEDTETNAPNIPNPTAGAGQTQQGAWVMPSGPPMYSDLGNQGGTEPNSNQGWTLPTAPPSYSDVPVQGIGAATAPPIVPDMTNLSLNPCPDLPPPTYDDAMRDKGDRKPVSGRWKGFFRDDRMEDITSFEMDINFHSSEILVNSGTIDGTGSDDVGEFDVLGTWKDDNTLSFTKSYRGSHNIYLSGKSDGDKKRKIIGTWDFNAGTTPDPNNYFEMSI